MLKTALIIGVTGQDGAYLADYLLGLNQYRVCGLVRQSSQTNLSNLEWLGIARDIELFFGDITDEGSVQKIIRDLQPDECYNLAAQSFVGMSWDAPKLTTEINAIGVLNILEAIKTFSPHTKFYQASTSEMFGNSELPVQNELTPFKPRSPYGVAKLYAHEITRNYRESYGVFGSCGILFNHESPLRGKSFVTRKITQGVANIVQKNKTHIRLGNIDAKRDWGYAGDYVVAMHKMLQQPIPDDFVIATGRSRSIRDFLEVAFSYVGIDDWEPLIIEDPTFKRPAELHSLCGDASKARSQLNWVPETGFQDLVHSMVAADIRRNINEQH